MSFGDFTYRLFYMPDEKYIWWPGGRMSKRNILAEDLKPYLRIVNNHEYGYNDNTGSYAPIQIHCITKSGRVRRVYFIQELL